ncbi:C4-dicarboxylate transport system, large permease component [Bacillus sp. OxB-1]|uniref:TRAP transporter large permease n=1 Tax=Bacillus sp. (strain OxB-1) TaxID=98228 RepID=UPI000581C3E5|nr:TRAP transporter large permease [Bacillus sp. OxB-1]BAQ09131.1 C4-dicarboxylate transport system, large permease component [Bacillus sp. OxB-1]
MILLLFLLFLVLIFLNMPIAFALGISSLAFIFLNGDGVLTVVPQRMFAAIDSFPLMAAPFFILAGKLMEHGGISERLINFAQSIVGSLRGGMAHVGIVTCLFFAALVGSGSVTTAAVGGIMIPTMVKAGYDRAFSTATIAAAGTTGIIIPPSVPLILYGVSAGVSVSSLFIAGIIPGLLIGVSLMVGAYTISLIKGYGKEATRFNFKDLFVSFKSAILALLMPIIILGGIYGGYFTPTEASVIAVVYGFIISFFVYKQINRKVMMEILVSTVVTSSVILIIIATASLFGMILTRENVPQSIASVLINSELSPFILIILINVLLLIVGAFMESLAAIIILTPLLVPVVTSFGMDPVHFGIIMIVNLSIGLITPPVGINLFVGSQVGKISFDKVLKAILPYMLIIIIDLLLIAFLPGISLFLVDFLK